MRSDEVGHAVVVGLDGRAEDPAEARGKDDRRDQTATYAQRRGSDGGTPLPESSAQNALRKGKVAAALALAGDGRTQTELQAIRWPRRAQLTKRGLHVAPCGELR